MISVVIPTLNAAPLLTKTFAALVPAVVDGVVREVIVADSGSGDATQKIADEAGARLLVCDAGRGVQLGAGAEIARHPWLLFLHADTVLEAGWHHKARTFIDQVETGRRRHAAATFRFALDDDGLRPRIVEWGVGLRTVVGALPYGDQGLLISRLLYDEVGGFSAMPLFEDVDIVRRIGRRRLTMLPVKASTGAARFREAGYGRRVLRNWWCVALYYLGTPAERLVKIYNA